MSLEGIFDKLNQVSERKYQRYLREQERKQQKMDEELYDNINSRLTGKEKPKQPFISSDHRRESFKTYFQHGFDRIVHDDQ